MYRKLHSLILKYPQKLCVRNRQLSTSLTCREKEPFVRDDRPNVNVGTIGASRHGKTLVSAAITKYISKCNQAVTYKSPDDIDTAKERESQHSQNATHIEWETDSFRFAHSDLPGHLSYYKNVVNHLCHLDSAILVINGEEGVDPNTVHFYYVAKHFGVRNIVPFINRTPETDNESVDLIKMELEELLDEREFGRLVVGSPMNEIDPLNDEPSGMEDLTRTLSSDVHLPERDLQSGLFWPLEQVGNIPSRGTFVAGRILHGRLKSGMTVDVYQNGKTTKATVRDLEVFRKVAPDLRAGDRGGAFIKQKTDIDLKRGGIIFQEQPGGTFPKGYLSSQEWTVGVKCVPGNGPTSFKGELVVFNSSNMDGKSHLGDGEFQVNDVEEQRTRLVTKNPIVAKSGDHILVRQGERVALGTIIEPQ